MTEEMLALVTPAGEPTGRSKAKSEVHRDGDWHRSVHLWIVTPGRRVLLQKRSTRKVNYPGLWDISAAGHVSAGESAVTAALREAEEELGLRFEAGDLRPLGVVRSEVVLNEGTYVEREFHDLFLVERDVSLDQLALQEEEVDAAVLVTIEEFAGRVAAGDPTLVPHDEEYAIVLEALRRRR